MASVASSLQRIKQDLGEFLPERAILTACEQAGHRWRQRKLGPVQTLHLFIVQVLHFNTAMTHLRHLAGQSVQASGYCQARMRLPLAVLQQLLVDSSAAMRRDSAPPPDGGDASASALWCGLRAYLVDGSSTIAPDTPPSQQAFGQPTNQKSGCGFPVPKILGLFDAFSGLIVQMLAFPLFTHEQSKVWQIHPLLAAGDLLVGDRGFCSFAHLAMLISRGVHGLFRIHQRTIVSFRPHRGHKGSTSRKAKRRSKRKASAEKGLPSSRFVRRLGRCDQLVEWVRPKARARWMSDEQYDLLPDRLLVRELRFTIPRRGQRTLCVTIATTLLDPILYPRERIAELYGVRWRVETHFAELKTTLRMRKVKSQTPEGVLKELAVYALVYNLVHGVMLKAAQRQGVSPERISFIDTVRWLINAAPGEPLPDLVVNPRRPGRHEPRVIKDLQDTYRKMTRPRKQLRKELKSQSVAA